MIGLRDVQADGRPDLLARLRELGEWAALGFYEVLARFLAQYMGGMALWGQTICFAILFLLLFAVLQTAMTQLLHEPINLGQWPEQIGRPVCGAILGWTVAGVILTAVSLAPLPLGYPYPRFEERRPDADKPSRVLINADGFLNAWFGLVSRGSLQALVGHQSFAVVHAGFLDQLYLNRLGIRRSVPLCTEDEAIEVPRKAAAWDAPEGITDAQGRTLAAKLDHRLMLARIGVKRNVLRDASPFTLSQVRLVCKPKEQRQSPLAGKGRAVYPLGIMVQARQLAVKGLDEQITLDLEDFGKDDVIRWIDFGFYVPNGWVPVLAQFKLNNIVEVSAPASTDQAPQVIPLVPRAEPKPADANQPADANKPAEASQPAPADANAPNASAAPQRGLSDISKSVIGDQVTEGN